MHLTQGTPTSFTMQRIRTIPDQRKVVQPKVRDEPPVGRSIDRHSLGRSGRVAAAWVARKYQQSPQDATQTVMEVAKQHGVQRLGDVDTLTEWLGDATIS